MVVKELPRTSPKSSATMIEFIREMLITAYNQNVTSLIYVMWGEDGREAHGVLDQDVTHRELERAVDFLDAWVADLDLDADQDDDDTGE